MGEGCESWLFLLFPFTRKNNELYAFSKILAALKKECETVWYVCNKTFSFPYRMEKHYFINILKKNTTKLTGVSPH